MDRRREDRLDHRLACRLELDLRRHHGQVLNLSPGGLFVETPARVPKARSVLVTVEGPGIRSGEVLKLQAAVARECWAPCLPSASATGGLGLVIRSVPDAWFDLLADLEPRNAVVAGGEALPPIRQLARARCVQCGREDATLWSGSCGWCGGTRPRRAGELKRLT